MLTGGRIETDTEISTAHTLRTPPIRLLKQITKGAKPLVPPGARKGS